MFKGGKVIASGGFGCIFDPAIKCNELNSDNSSNPDNSSNQISKLMVTKYAKDEFKQIQKYNNILKVIPNYSNYFLLNNFKLCSPSKLTKEDLNGFTKKCKPLKKKGINVKNINQSLDKIMAINMPNGGIDVEKFVENNYTMSNFIRLNNSLIKLLINGILPMNNLNVYHCDIKATNVLVVDSEAVKTDLITRLIDWGLSVVYDKTKVGIPNKLYRRPFQFNVPFSNILFNKNFILLYNNFLELNPNPNFYQIREFVINYIFIWNDIRGTGHLSAINGLIKKLTLHDIIAIKKEEIKNHFIEYDFTYYYIIEYLTKILEKYTYNGKLDLISYFEQVFLKNIDIWGFTFIYIILYEELYKSYNDLNEYQMQFINKIKYIIIHFLYESPITPIDVSSLVNELTNLNKIIKNFDKNTGSKKLEYVSKLEENIGILIKNKNNSNTYKFKKFKKHNTRKRR